MSIEKNQSIELRKHIVNSIISFCDLFLGELPEKTRGDIIYCIHLYGFGAVILYVLFFGKRLAFQIFLMISILILLQLFILRGCVLTKVEQHYRKEKGTTVDIFLRFLDIETTNPNRKLITLTGYSIIIVGMFGIYLREVLFMTYIV